MTAPRRLWIVATLSLLACVGGTPAPAERKPPPRAPTGAAPQLPDVDKLIADQKLSEAVALLDTIVAQATAKHEDDRLGLALITRTQLSIALGGWETAVAKLRAATWPKAPLPSIAVELYYASSLTTYVRSYAWEIGKREKIEHKAGAPLDLKTLSRDELIAEAAHAYARVWVRREDVGDWAVGTFGAYLTPNTYPANVRGTVRDAITYLVVEHLADSSLWKTGEANDSYRVDLTKMLGAVPNVAIDSEDHPIVKVVAALDDLERFHVKAGRPEAALEARLERLRRLHAAFTKKDERDRLEHTLEERLAKETPRPWWSMGRVLASEWAYDRGDRVVAHRLAKEGHDRYPSSMGGALCQRRVATIEAPELGVSAMAVDGVGRPTIAVTARGLSRVYFRAYATDPEAKLGKARDYDLYLERAEIDALRKHAPTASWSAALPSSPDFYSHQTLVTPPLPKGFYIVVSSAREDFSEHQNLLHALELSISDLVLVTRDQSHGDTDARVLDGRSGKPVEGADIELWQLDWSKGHHKVGTVRTDSAGHAKLPTHSGPYVAIPRRGNEISFDPSVFYAQPSGAEGTSTSSLVYTDRSVYRPGQTIDWKIVAYSGKHSQGKFAVDPNHSLTVSLFDASSQVVQKIDVVTSAYGSADGRFTIPTGRLLGAWRIGTTNGGGASVRVEEYKRPTFEVSLKPPTAPLVLNKPAKLTGEARYYFGLPVTSGKAHYVVTREPVYPSWWGWYFHDGAEQTQTIAQGTSPLSADGTFDVAFSPEVSPTSDRAVTYRYAISADVTDDGGETRSASRSYRLGFSTVEASLSSEHGFATAGTAQTLALRRTDLDGTPRAGKGTYRVYKLVQPDHALLPAEGSTKPSGTAFAQVIADDAKTPRSSATYDREQLVAQWKDGDEVAHREVVANADGVGTVSFPALAGGAYRVRYETRDEAQQKSTTFADVLVAGDSAVHLAAVLALDSHVVHVGQKARLLVQSGIGDEAIVLETLRDGTIIDRKLFTSPHQVLELPVTEADRGGLAFELTCVRDHQVIRQTETLVVPWDNQSLKLAFATFRDHMRPGEHETFRVTVQSDGTKSERLAAGAELLAYMYDRSLDLFAPHHPPTPLSLFPIRTYAPPPRVGLGQAHTVYLESTGLSTIPVATTPRPDTLHFVDGYAVGGMGDRFGGRRMFKSAPPSPMMAHAAAPAARAKKMDVDADGIPSEDDKAEEKPRAEPELAKNAIAGKTTENPQPLRSNFAETAFWKPTLLLDEKGETSFDFVVPDSVTSWNVWVHAITKDLRSGSIVQQTRSVKDLMVRPYLPRFLREGDAASLEVVVNNAGPSKLDGTLSLDVLDPATQKSRIGEFGLGKQERRFSVEPGKSAHVAFTVTAPKKVDTYAFVVRATSRSGLSDGELRPLPVLPSRLHLTQSRFVTLHDADRRTMHFAELAKADDASRVNEQMVVTLDAQLFYTVLRALPYLISYPYECAEQTMNRFLSTGIVSSLFDQYPAVAKMADQMSKRQTQLQPWDAGDANRKMALEEAPFLTEANGGATDPLINALDRRIAAANRDSALDRLRKMQTSAGGFPWFPGGPPSPYMTLYLLQGFARATEFKLQVPKDMVQRGWQYMARHYHDEYASKMIKDDCCWEFLALLNYVASAYPDDSWTNGALTMAERKQILDFTFKHWTQSSPRIKGLLALTLFRMGRPADAKKVFASVMDSAKVSEDRGTYWAPEDRSWLWYNDTTESQAFALRVLLEIDPNNAKKDGLVLWLLLDKKLNQWKSTRATAEVLYSLAKYMTADRSLGVREAATVSVGPRQQTYTFEPDRYVGKVQMMIPGQEVSAKSAHIVVDKKTKGTMFASATWSFATDKLPTEGSGDFFTVTRTYYRRQNDGKAFTLQPLAEGAQVAVGDELEVQLAISSKHEAEYVHLRDPRAAGLEPSSVASHWGYDLGLSYYEEVRDSGENFFFEHLPAGQYTFRYRVRAATAGTFRVGPATLQSMYAPEFNAYSAGHVVKVNGR